MRTRHHGITTVVLGLLTRRQAGTTDEVRRQALALVAAAVTAGQVVPLLATLLLVIISLRLDAITTTGVRFGVGVPTTIRALAAIVPTSRRPGTLLPARAVPRSHCFISAEASSV